MEKGYEYNKKVDVWSLGVLFLLLINLPTNDNFFKRIENNHIIRYSGDLGDDKDDFQELIDKMLEVDVEKRANIDDLLEIKIFRNEAIKQFEKVYALKNAKEMTELNQKILLQNIELNRLRNLNK